MTPYLKEQQPPPPQKKKKKKTKKWGEILPQGKEVLQGDIVGSLHQVCEPVARRSD